MSNQRLPSTDYVLINQSARQSEQSVSCVPKFKRFRSIQKTNEHVYSEFYYWILHHPQNFQSPIANDCLKITIDEKNTAVISKVVIAGISQRAA